MAYIIDGVPREVIGGAIRFQPSGSYFVAFAFEISRDDITGKMPGTYVAVGVGTDPAVTERLSWTDDAPLPEDLFSMAEWILLPGFVAAGLFSQGFIVELMRPADTVEGCPDCEAGKPQEAAESAQEGEADEEASAAD